MTSMSRWEDFIRDYKISGRITRDFLKGQNFSLFFDIYAIPPSFFRRYTDIAVYRREKIQEARHVDTTDHV